MKQENLQNDFPTVLVILGATGDLVTKKIVPSLFKLYESHALPRKFRVVGLSKQSISKTGFEDHVYAILHLKLRRKHTSYTARFAHFFSHVQGWFEKMESYKRLAEALLEIDDEWGVCTNKIFYLAASPEHYETIFRNLARSGLTIPCGPNGGWTRVLVEKPFGKDARTAERLDTLLGTLFREEQIYRIDHYLAKEMLQNILTFRFGNNLFEDVWNRKHIESIDIRLWEKIGVEDRGVFYEGVGALRDVGQNHLLQMLALVTMDRPQNMGAKEIRQKREAMLRTLKSLSKEEIRTNTFRAQYKGYRKIQHVSPRSNVETYFKLRAYLSHPRWAGIPITMESGKRMGRTEKKIVVTFRHPVPCLCPRGVHYKNKVTFHLEPEEAITVEFWSKKPGLTTEFEKREIEFHYRGAGKRVQYTEEYGKLLLDAIKGDQTLFIDTQEVGAMWRFTDPIVRAWQKNIVPLELYAPDTHEVSEKSTRQEESHSGSVIKKEIGMIGLGKMGGNAALRLLERGWRVVGYDPHAPRWAEFKNVGMVEAKSFLECIKSLKSPRIIFLMVPSGKPVDEILFGRGARVLRKGDIVIDAGNSFFEDSMRRARRLRKRGIYFMDVGFSGGPAGALDGACLMIGGDKKIHTKLDELWSDLAILGGYRYVGLSGAGHFVKMVHNGIEYGMMQSLAEGFTLLKQSPFNLNLQDIAALYNRGSVVTSRLVGWLESGYKQFGRSLKEVSGTVHATGEGSWTVKTGKKYRVNMPVIEDSVKFRKQSEKKPSYTGKILSALRNQFGGHSIE